MVDQLVADAALDAQALAGLRETVRGPVLAPDDPGYDEARAIWNGLIDRRPALIVQCTRRGRRRRRGQLRARAGARCSRSRAAGTTSPATPSTTAGSSSTCRRCAASTSIRPARTVRVQGGATWGDVDRETQLFGLAVPGRRRLDDGHRRPDAARRRRPPAPQARALDRQPALGRHRHRRRAAAAGERDGERGPVLGRARRRQQLRRRHVVRVPGAPGRPDGHGRRDLLSRSSRRGRCCRPGATSWPRRPTS